MDPSYSLEKTIEEQQFATQELLTDVANLCLELGLNEVQSLEPEQGQGEFIDNFGNRWYPSTRMIIFENHPERTLRDRYIYCPWFDTQGKETGWQIEYVPNSSDDDSPTLRLCHTVGNQDELCEIQFTLKWEDDGKNRLATMLLLEYDRNTGLTTKKAIIMLIGRINGLQYKDNAVNFFNPNECKTLLDLNLAYIKAALESQRSNK